MNASRLLVAAHARGAGAVAAQGSRRPGRPSHIPDACRKRVCVKSSRARIKILSAQQYAPPGVASRPHTVGLVSAAGICLFGNDTVCLAHPLHLLAAFFLSPACGLWSSIGAGCCCWLLAWHLCTLLAHQMTKTYARAAGFYSLARRLHTYIYILTPYNCCIIDRPS
jgi:hypothetical protein